MLDALLILIAPDLLRFVIRIMAHVLHVTRILTALQSPILNAIQVAAHAFLAQRIASAKQLLQHVLTGHVINVQQILIALLAVWVEFKVNVIQLLMHANNVSFQETVLQAGHVQQQDFAFLHRHTRPSASCSLRSE